MRSTLRVLFFLKRDKQKANGHTPIFCRITIDKQEARFGIKKDVNPAMWDVKAGKAIGRTNEAVDINTVIDQTKSVLFSIYNELLLSEVNVTVEKVKNHFLGGASKDHNLLEQFQRHNEDVEKLIGISKSKATYQKYEVTRKHLDVADATAKTGNLQRRLAATFMLYLWYGVGLLPFPSWAYQCLAMEWL